MSLTFKTTAAAALPFLPLVDATAAPFRIYNDGGATVTAKVFVTGTDGAAAATVTDENGKEISIEGWVGIRPTTGGAYATLKEPTFPDAFADLSTDCYSTSISAGSYVELELLLTVPDSFDTSGLTHWVLAVMAVDA